VDCRSEPDAVLAARTDLTPTAPRLVAVLWSGSLGGAETFTAELCRVLRELGADARVLFVTHEEPLASRLRAANVPYATLGLHRGRGIVLRPLAFARAARSLGPDGAILVSPGYLGAALRLGGYRGKVAVVLHDLVQTGLLSTARRIVKRVDRLSGGWATNVEVAVSDFVLAAARRDFPRRRNLVRIYNGIDLDVYSPGRNGSDDVRPVIGWAGRIVEGKGLDTLLRAIPAVRARYDVQLRIAGDGPERPRLEQLADELGLRGSVVFEGWSPDMPAFWRGCSVAAIPPVGAVESFGMVAIEAMACGRPVVASRAGALPELVVDGVTGRLVPPGDHEALTAALLELVGDEARRATTGAAARERCEAHFDLRQSAQAYLDLFRTS
jgi:glycosyltransferase involved in cell wall biosynthesis